MKNIIILSLCLLSGMFSQAQTVAIGTASSARDNNMQVMHSPLYSTGKSSTDLVTENPVSFENKTSISIRKPNAKSPDHKWFERMSKWFSYNYQKMRESVNQWLYLEMNEDSYGWGAY